VIPHLMQSVSFAQKRHQGRPFAVCGWRLGRLDGYPLRIGLKTAFLAVGTGR
jgi:hypothetical protein